MNGEDVLPWKVRFQTISFVDKILFVRHLQVMMKAGFSIAEGLKTISRQIENTRFKAVVDMVAVDVEGGLALSVSLKKFPHIFPDVMVRIIEAGEESGEMSELLERLAVHMKKTHALKSKVRSAMLYPCVVLVAMITVGIVTITFVIPRMLTVFEAANVQLPLPTRILIGIGQFLLQQGIWVAVGVVILVILLIQVSRTPNGRLWIDKILLKLPIVGRIIQKTNIANFTRTLSSFLKTDIPIVRTFEVVAMTLGNRVYQTVIKEASEELRRGVAISSVLLRYPDLFPPMATQFFVTGEETGTLDTVITEIAEFYDADVEETLTNLSTIIEPVLILILGAGVAGLAVAVLLPLMSLSSVIK